MNTLTSSLVKKFNVRLPKKMANRPITNRNTTNPKRRSYKGNRYTLLKKSFRRVNGFVRARKCFKLHDRFVNLKFIQACDVDNIFLPQFINLIEDILEKDRSFNLRILTRKGGIFY